MGNLEKRKHRKGVRIKNAVIDPEKGLDLKSGEVNCEVEFIECEFQADVNFEADQVVIRRRDNESKQLPWYARWPYWFFWDFLAGYGRYPSRTFILGLLIVLGGIGVYNPRYLKKEDRVVWHLSFYLFYMYTLFTLWHYLKKSNFGEFFHGITDLGKQLLLRLLISLDQFIP
ncbi:MAG: hypothetical protein ACUVXF_12910, partial [Desulfobaccales bacterium]